MMFRLLSAFLVTSLAHCFAPLSAVHHGRHSSIRQTVLAESADEVDVLAINNDNNDDETLSFEDLGLCPETLAAVRSQPNWKRPTPVQRMAIPQLLRTETSALDDADDDTMQHKDALWCEAPTGSGKTAAYVLPLLQNMLKNPQGKSGRVSSLVLCPTRELAEQIGSVIYNLANNVSTSKRKQKWNIMSIYGGIPLEPQISQLADYAKDGEMLDVLIATPGRLVDVLTYYDTKRGSASAVEAAFERRLLDAMGDGDASLNLEKIETLKLDREDDDGRGSLKRLLADLEYLVVDEADRLLGRAFTTELDSVLKLLPKKKIQTWLFSATFPKQIEPRVNQVLSVIYSIKYDDDEVPILRISCSNSDRIVQEEVSLSLQKKLERSSVSSYQQLQSVGPASTIGLRTIRLEKPARTQALRKLLEENEDWDRVLVFVSTRYAAEHVSRKLRKVGIKSAELHGKLDQAARSRRLGDLKRGKIRVLLATDVASRGIDITNLPAMVNYDLPRSTADFVHRIGRVGRAGQYGTAVSFVTPATETHLDLIETRHLATSVDREVMPGFEPDEDRWAIESAGSVQNIPGALPSDKGLAHDKMFGGVKGRRKSKKDKLREAAARKVAQKGK